MANMNFPQMPLSPSHQAPMGPQGFNMQGNMMVQGNMMLVPADGPYYSHGQPPPAQNFAPPRPAQDSDDLLDVRSFDSMDFMNYESQHPVLPPAGLTMNNGVLHKSSDATTSTGEGTSGSASNSD
jgi:hypothetical protein